MAGSVTRRGLDMTGFVLELRGMCVVLEYPHGVDYQARPLPEQEGEDAEPHAGWEVTAVILSGSPERTSLAVTAGGDSFPAACQNAALLAIGTLHIFAAHQLQGPASLWWDHFQATHPEGQPITWARFTAAFRRTHVPAGVVALKKREFRELKQGNRSVMEDLHEFNNLARYAPEDVREDEEEPEKFLAGMDPELSVRL